MTNPELMPIGAFAKLAGLSASALRFYDDACLLHPEQVDPVTGYRLYSEAQLARASQLRQLREIGMPLAAIGRFFSAGPQEAAQMIDHHVAEVAAEAAGIQRAAATLKASLGEAAHLDLCTLSGPVLAAAIDQIAATTMHNVDIPVLNGVHLESNPDAISLTSTDRYRLATRTLVPNQPSAASWAGTLAADDLRAAASRLRRSPIVTLEANEQTLGLRMVDRTVAHCRLLTEAFPDYKLMVSSLPAVTQRVTVEKKGLLKALEQQAWERIGLRITSGQPSVLLGDRVLELDGNAFGPDLTVWFELTTLYPAIGHTLGNDLMLDLRGADQPATIRSADDGDFTTLAMPCLETS
ncbi:MerR family transcriptional regulator [Mycolicibacterium flavescens]|uniref:Transcriptional regulator n=1 Tax=Mycolicibacterium flavescens TaxID=1776 RepID=A0A1E3RH68_MYCFV|nr:MerR family transcriptional regulator [Mycolicibacterium flavescens]MCV7283138.1 MerR family transcriptional regulator [Mycolicibacterium flavescens]ODQ89179.1 transcriptional regulator [Mycolicibacterium flavescens]